MPTRNRLDPALVDGLVRPLLKHLTDANQPREEQWQGWAVTPVYGGRNNLLYRATCRSADLAVKFCIEDERDRAGREFGSLSVLEQAGLCIGPSPVLLEREIYHRPVIVTTWLPGVTNTRLPESDSDWHRLVEHLATIHSVKPVDARLTLSNSTLFATTAAEAVELVHSHATRIPLPRQEPGLQSALRRLQLMHLPNWPAPALCLCRLDNGLSNYVRRPGAWASVDWEYSGWCDPAFDLANMLTHVALKDAPRWRRDWAIEAYGRLVNDGTIELRTETYCKILVIWWATRLARYLYEIPRGLDPRLATWDPGWRPDIRAKYEHCLANCQTELD
jgi:thiamine kinase-like enzyme